ncbi:hypothetical protein GEV33_000164 [Tenebrio molitor]|uniref:Uncharacterized protein n=1 Tax=Tenebrio molitor TaxID=7067 RepID=A0A8J6HYM8_TENMO|nr:hypothetical protein GEV33_000164 [Tenebrio molitor]
MGPWVRISVNADRLKQLLQDPSCATIWVQKSRTVGFRLENHPLTLTHIPPLPKTIGPDVKVSLIRVVSKSAPGPILFLLIRGASSNCFGTDLARPSGYKSRTVEFRLENDSSTWTYVSPLLKPIEMQISLILVTSSNCFRTNLVQPVDYKSQRKSDFVLKIIPRGAKCGRFCSFQKQ